MRDCKATMNKVGVRYSMLNMFSLNLKMYFGFNFTRAGLFNYEV